MELHMSYDPQYTKPMAEELTSLGIKELNTPNDVDSIINSDGTILFIVNSVCGCAAGKARPGVKLALKNQKLPDKIVTVFAGVDREATKKAREYFVGHEPSSPQIVLMKNKKILFILQRWDIENKEAEKIADQLKKAFNEYC